MGRRKKIIPVTAPIPDVAAYPDLIVVLLGMRVPSLPRIATLQGIKTSVEKLPSRSPAGLLHIDTNIVFSVVPFHIGIRWYWQDPEALSAWLRSDAHRRWWAQFVEETRGTHVWHEAYHPRSGPTSVSRGPGLPSAFERYAPEPEPRERAAAPSRRFEYASNASVW